MTNETPTSEQTDGPLIPSGVSVDPVRGADRTHRTVLLLVRLLYLVLLVTVALLPFVGSITENQTVRRFSDYAWALVATLVFGSAVLLIDALTKNKKLASVFGIYLGIVAGLVAAFAIGALLDLVTESWDLTSDSWVAYMGLVKTAVGITLCYLAVSIVMTTKDDFRLVIPYVEFAKEIRGVRPMLLDTSALIDGRIDGFAQTGFLDAPLVVPKFVVNELQTLADSADKLERARGRRGLDMVGTLQKNGAVDLTLDDSEYQGHSVDHLLLRMAADRKLRILTTDYNLNKVAQIHGVTVLNLNDLTGALQAQVLPGEPLRVEIVKRGENPEQGVGYLPDGTMVVVEGAAGHLGEPIDTVVTNALQTSAGRMVFARLRDDDATGEITEQLAKSATSQPRVTARPPQRRESSSARNPRR